MRGAIAPLPQYALIVWYSVKAQGLYYYYYYYYYYLLRARVAHASWMAGVQFQAGVETFSSPSSPFWIWNPSTVICSGSWSRSSLAWRWNWARSWDIQNALSDGSRCPVRLHVVVLKRRSNFMFSGIIIIFLIVLSNSRKFDLFISSEMRRITADLTCSLSVQHLVLCYYHVPRSYINWVAVIM